MTRLSRRMVLRGAGGLALSLPLLTSLEARGQSVSVPKRFLVFFHPNGVLPSEWFPTAGATDSEFTLPKSLEPLAPFRSDILLTRGLDMKCTAPGPGEPHQRGMGAMLTGRHLLEGNQVGGDGSLAGYASGISIDQRIAQVYGTGTKFGSVQLGIRSRGGDVRHHLNYAGPNQPLPVQSDPKAVFEQMFSSISTPAQELERIRLRRASVLDAVRGQLSSLTSKLPSSDRQQLDQHLSLVRDMESRLNAASGAGAACVAPSAPATQNPNSAETMQSISRLQIDMMVLLFACDLTRVGTLQYSEAQNHITFPWLGSTIDGHELSHLGNSDPLRADIGKRDRWYAGEFAYLLGRLKSIPEGEGTMLDHTAILWGNELAEGNSHSHANMPFLLAGHGAKLRMGRYVRYNGASHNDLLVSLLNGLGIPDATFGNPDYCTGPLPGLA